MALSNVTLPYALKIAKLGWEAACEQDEGLKKGLNIYGGKVSCDELIKVFGL